MRKVKAIYSYNQYDAIQVTWKTWNDVCSLLEDVISEKNPARSVETFSDSCQEQGPLFIELTIPTPGGPEIVRHGDWIFKDSTGKFLKMNPDIFKQLYEIIS